MDSNAGKLKYFVIGAIIVVVAYVLVLWVSAMPSHDSMGMPLINPSGPVVGVYVAFIVAIVYALIIFILRKRIFPTSNTV